MILSDGDYQLTLEQEVQDLINKGAAIEMMALPDSEYNTQMFKVFKEMRKALILMDAEVKHSREAHHENEMMWERDYHNLERDFAEYRRSHPDKRDEKVCSIPVTD